MIFAFFDPSPLTVCINCSFKFLFAVLLLDSSRILIMFINTIFLIFQAGGRPPSWIFLKFEISTAGPVRMRRC